MTTEKAAFVCSHVYDQSRPVLMVVRQGGDWQFLCGHQHAADDVPHVVGLKHMFEIDASIKELSDLPNECEAERIAINAPWIRTGLKPSI